MTSIPLKPESLALLKGKVVVITGTAHGIGAATVRLLAQHGAHVVSGDWDSASGEAVNAAIRTTSLGSAHFVKTDVTDYESVLGLFNYAVEKWGRVDVAISNAGIQEVGGWFEGGEGLESVKTKPSTKVIEVNLVGTLYFARIAIAYLQHNMQANDDKSLILVSSTAGFKETPKLPIYSAAKHGVLGLMRSLRPAMGQGQLGGVRINAVCPWMTDTGMVDGIRDVWVREGLPVNQPGDVGRVMVELAVERGWDIEEGLERTERIWLGEKVAATLERGQEILGDGRGWGKADRKSIV